MCIRDRVSRVPLVQAKVSGRRVYASIQGNLWAWGACRMNVWVLCVCSKHAAVSQGPTRQVRGARILIAVLGKHRECDHAGRTHECVCVLNLGSVGCVLHWCVLHCDFLPLPAQEEEGTCPCVPVCGVSLDRGGSWGNTFSVVTLYLWPSVWPDVSVSYESLSYVSMTVHRCLWLCLGYALRFLLVVGITKGKGESGSHIHQPETLGLEEVAALHISWHCHSKSIYNSLI